MRKIFFAALAAAAVLSSRAEAMKLSGPPGLAAGAALVQKAATVCGTNGCVRVQTAAPRKKQNHPPFVATRRTL